MARAPRKTKAQLEAEAEKRKADRELDAVGAICTAIERVNASEDPLAAASLVLLTIQAGKVPGVSFTP